MLRKIAECLLIALVLAGCNLQQQEVTATPPTPELPATPVTGMITPVIPAALPVTADSQQEGVCYFMPYGIGAPFDALSVPDTAQSSPVKVGVMDAMIYYPVVSVIDIWVQVVVSEGVVGWIRYGVGGLYGACDNIPRSTQRPPVPENICTLYYDKVMQDDVIYTDSDVTTVLEPLQPGIYYTAISRSEHTGWRVQLSDGRTGWVTTPEPILRAFAGLNGPCDDLPREKSALDGG